MSTEHDETGSLDSFFKAEDDDHLLVEDIGTSHEHVDHSEHDDVVHPDESDAPKKKSIFKRWYFWVGAVLLFLMLVGGLYVQQMMAANNQTAVNAYPMVDTPHPAEPPQAAPAPTPAPAVSVAAASAAQVVAIMPDQVAASQPSSVGSVKDDPSKSRVESLEKQVGLLSSELEEEKKLKLDALAKLAILEKSHAGRPAVVAKKVGTAKRKEPMVSTVDSGLFVDYHVDAITPGQARITHGSESTYVIVGSTIKNAKVTKIKPDSGEVVTTRGVIQ